METENVVKKITEAREGIKTAWKDPVSLSEKMLVLATFNAYLADSLAGLHATATTSAFKSFKRARDASTSITESELLSRFESVEDRKAYEDIKHIHKATSDLISVIQSHLRVVDNQRKQEGLNT